MKKLNLLLGIICAVLSIAVSSSAHAEWKSTDLSANRIVCKESNEGSSFVLSRHEDGLYSLTYYDVAKVFGEGYFKLAPVEVAVNLKCFQSSSGITCSSMQEQVVNIPRAGIQDKKVSRQNNFRIGLSWDGQIGVNPAHVLKLVAEFDIPIAVGEWLKPIVLRGKNTKTNEEMDFNFNKSSIAIRMDGESASCEAR